MSAGRGPNGQFEREIIAVGKGGVEEEVGDEVGVCQRRKTP